MTRSTVHACAVLIGAKAALIRGPAGSGKSSLVWNLLQARSLPFTRLVADDRAFVEAQNGRLLVRPAPELAGLIEIRGLGIRRVAFEPVAEVALVIDLAAPDGARLQDTASRTEIAGVSLLRLAVAPGMDALPAVLALVGTAEGRI